MNICVKIYLKNSVNERFAKQLLTGFLLRIISILYKRYTGWMMSIVNQYFIGIIYNYLINTQQKDFNLQHDEPGNSFTEKRPFVGIKTAAYFLWHPALYRFHHFCFVLINAR